MLDEAFTPGFRARLHLKDAHIVSNTARELGVPTPGFAPVEAELQRLVEEGKGDLDHSALITLLEEDVKKE
jgi:2-hydroxy-3-oxopropionate reductase